jgi:VWFA-related protein
MSGRTGVLHCLIDSPMTQHPPSRRLLPTSARRAAAALLALAMAGGPARAQDDARPPVAESLEVLLVNVEVWAHDRQDNPVYGLTAEDFEILEDGVPVPITHFAEVRETPPAVYVHSAPARPQPAEPPRAATEEPGHLVVYFDQLNLTPTSARRITDEIRSFLATSWMEPQRVLVVRQGYEMFTEAGFGSTQQQIDGALTRIASGGMLGEMDPQRSLGRLQMAWDRAKEISIGGSSMGGGAGGGMACDFFVPDAKGEIAAHVAELERRTSTTLDSLRTTAALLSALPGHKTLIFVSDGLATRPGADLVRFAQNACPGRPELNEISQAGDAAQLGQRLQSFAQEANRNRITVYPFQAAGLRGSALGGADQRTLDHNNASGVEGLQRLGNRDGLMELARQTGGVAVVNRNDFALELKRVAADMTSYYSLAYAPPSGGDGFNHTIEVRGKGPRTQGLRLRHRLGYRDKGPTDVLQERLEGAIAFGVIRNPLGVRLAVGDLAAAGEGLYSVPLHVLVPSTGIAFLPEAGGDRASMRVAIQASNARTGAAVKRDESFRPVQPPPESSLLNLRMRLELPAGVHVVAVAVRDELAREISVVATTVAIHDPAEAEAAASEGSRER